ncbi:MAG: rhamnulokinase [Chloroflexi bacterium]|nr:rhamnulokinase [Chloroflexota bacterium]
MVSALAFDLGASGGRAVVGQLESKQAERLTITEIHRFPNDPARVHRRMYWDILRLFHEVKQGIHQTHLAGYRDLQSMGIDTWGVDFGLIGSHGELLGNPYHYRDDHTLNIMEELWQVVPREEIFARTGIQFMPINTIYQLYALKEVASPVLDKAEALLMIPDLLRYFLTGEQHNEWTNASTTQLCNPYTRSWDKELIEKLGLPPHIFLEPVAPGTQVGSLLPSISNELRVPATPVIAVAEHDTGSAVVAVPAESLDFAYISCGTWSLIGTEISEPLINEQSLALNFTNEGGVNNTSRLLKNVTGLWLIQECRRVWRNEGKNFSYQEELRLVEQAQPIQSFIDPDHPMFVNPLHMPRQVQQYCRETKQQVPETEGELLRCIVQSLACKYRLVLEQIEQLTQKHFPGLHMVGGGIQNTVLCQYTANALARPVWAGPQESTAIGNLLVQYTALSHIEDIQQARRIVRNSFPIKTYVPQEMETWERAFEQFCACTQAYNVRNS